MMNSRYVLPFLCLLLVFVNNTVAHGQATTCQIGYLAFKYPNSVIVGEHVKIFTGVDVSSCTMGGSWGTVGFRVDLYDDAQHALLSSNSSISSNSTVDSDMTLSGIVANVTNIISAPLVPGDYAVYTAAIASNAQGSVIGSYDTSFSFTVALNESVTTPTG